MMISTRRFCARPSGVRFDAIGWSSPRPKATIRLPGTPLSRRTSATDTRAALRQVLVVGRRPGVVGMADHFDPAVRDISSRLDATRVEVRRRSGRTAALSVANSRSCGMFTIRISPGVGDRDVGRSEPRKFGRLPVQVARSARRCPRPARHQSVAAQLVVSARIAAPATAPAGRRSRTVLGASFGSSG